MGFALYVNANYYHPIGGIAVLVATALQPAVRRRWVSLSEPISSYEIRIQYWPLELGVCHRQHLAQCLSLSRCKVKPHFLALLLSPLHRHHQALKPEDVASLEIKTELRLVFFSQSRPVPWQTTPGFAAQTEFQLQILNLLVPRGCCSVDPSLIRAESPYYWEKTLSQL